MFSSVVDFGTRNPLPYQSGHGQTVEHSTRAELIEIQKADLGRKYARVDRRPLDPPPVVIFKLYEVTDPGTDQEEEREVSNYDEVHNVGLICTVDLFPVHPGAEYEAEQRRRRASGSGDWEEGSSSSGSSTPIGSHYTTSGGSRRATDSLPPFSTVSSSSFDDNTEPDVIVHHVNNYPVLEGSKVTTSLVGNLVVQPNVVDYQGRKALVFVFPDLAVKAEGHFILRYRVFDLYSKARSGPSDSKIGMQAECYGGPFRVYSTKEFPGLNASTELTKHLARWGVRLNIRETERRRRRRSDEGGASTVAESSPYTTTPMN